MTLSWKMWTETKRRRRKLFAVLDSTNVNLTVQTCQLVTCKCGLGHPITGKTCSLFQTLSKLPSLMASVTPPSINLHMTNRRRWNIWLTASTLRHLIIYVKVDVLILFTFFDHLWLVIEPDVWKWLTANLRNLNWKSLAGEQYFFSATLLT